MLTDYRELHIGFTLHTQHLINCLQTDLHRLLYNHVFPGAHGLASDFPVQTTGHADIYHVQSFAS